VREKFGLAADVWTKLADNEERREAAMHVHRARVSAAADAS
jgi:hypothetical protein